jgi:carbonic anhydrase
MDRIIKGVAKFQREVFPAHKHRFEDLKDRQDPEFLFITCADSRIVPQLITQTDPGDLFICRNAGNMVPPYGEATGGVSATIEYAVCVLGVKHIIICGHTDCGAMRALLNPDKLAGLPTVQKWLGQGEVARTIVTENYQGLSEGALLHRITEENVLAQIEHLRTHPSVASRLARGDITLHGWIYHIRTGDVDAWDAKRSRFVPLSEYEVVASSPRIARAG